LIRFIALKFRKSFVRLNLRRAFSLFLFVFNQVHPGFGAFDSQVGYYLRLRNDEFMQMMIPKEKYLLGQVFNIHEEIRERNSEGMRILDLGIDEAISPKKSISDMYAQEVDRILRLSQEIVKLERKARMQADMRVLESLAGLKKQIQNILGADSFSARSGEADSTRSRPGASGLKRPDQSFSGTDLFEEWKYNQLLDFKTKQTLYEYLLARLIRTASPAQEKRMFQHELKTALESYAAGDYVLARLQLLHILERYGQKNTLDDVLYYAAECSYALNHIDESLDAYRRLLAVYPNSPMRPKALVKIVYIDYLYKNTDRLFADYDSLLHFERMLDAESFGAVSYLVGLTHFQNRQYAKAADRLRRVPANASAHYPALYLTAVTQSNLGNDENALAIYHAIADQESKTKSDPVLAQMKNNALLKLGLIYYERGENRRAISLFNRISQEFIHYDLGLLGKAWSAYRSGRPAEALENAEQVIDNAVFSTYAYEAKVLAARSKELLGQKDAAISDLKQVTLAGNSAETVKAETLKLQQIESNERTALEDRQRRLFSEAGRIRQFLAVPETDSRNVPLKGDNALAVKTSQLSDRIKILDSLETQAKTGKDSTQLEKIRKLRGNLYSTLQGVAPRPSPPQTGDPLIQRMGMSSYLKYLFGTLLRETIYEKEETRNSIRDASFLAEQARKQGQTGINVTMEIKQEELEEYYRKLNQYEVWLRENTPQEFRVELDMWAGISQYGISNINFLRIKDIDARIINISKSLGGIEKTYAVKRNELEKRIQGLLNDVAQIEKQMRHDEDARNQKEKERFFKNDYFERQKTEPSTGQLKEKTDAERAKTP
jgi:TolA-binding protein